MKNFEVGFYLQCPTAAVTSQIANVADIKAGSDEGLDVVMVELFQLYI